MEYPNMPLVTCCIPTYRKFDYLFEALNSVIIQKYNNIELIICDDGSDNFPKEKIEQYIIKHKKENIKNTIVIQNEKNVGTVKTMNRVLKISKGDYLINIAPDDVFYDECVIERVVQRFLDTGWKIISCRRLRCEEKSLTPIRYMPPDSFIPKIELLDTAEKQYRAFALSRFYEMASGSSTYYCRTLLKQYGLYDEDYRLLEDWSFFTKYTREGHLIHTAYDIVAIRYREGGVSTTTPDTVDRSVNKFLLADGRRLIEKEVLPFLDCFTWLDRRMLKGTHIWRINQAKKLKRIALIFLYPDLVLYKIYSKMKERICSFRKIST